MQSNRSSLMTRDAWEHIIIASSTHDIENLSDVGYEAGIVLMTLLVLCILNWSPYEFNGFNKLHFDIYYLCVFVARCVKLPRFCFVTIRGVCR